MWVCVPRADPLNVGAATEPVRVAGVPLNAGAELVPAGVPERIVAGGPLRYGATISCGCSRREDRYNVRAAMLTEQIRYSYELHAAKRNVAWALSEDYFLHIILEPCYYCGVPPANKQTSKSGDKFIYSGIDRISNQLGYTIENTVPCCRTCNRAKSNLTLDEFFTWIRRLIEKMTERQS